MHVFEQRYKQMTADALQADRCIAMALLEPGWEHDYDARPRIDPVVCVGTILSSERLPDGRYNMLLQGRCRARIIRERREENRAYRVADLLPAVAVPVMEIDLDRYRRQLIDLFCGKLGQSCLGEKFRHILSSPIPTPDAADLIAFNFIDDVSLRQALLAEERVEPRLIRLISALRALPPCQKTLFRKSLSDVKLN